MLAAVLYLAKENSTQSFIDIKHIGSHHIAFYLTLLIILILLFLWLLELKVIHPLLRGAVKFGEDLEKTSITKNITGTSQGMTELISLYSKYKEVERCTDIKDNSIVITHRSRSNKRSLSTKMNWGYLIALMVLILIALAMFNIVKVT
ncbi:MAG: hypothetical protein LEGION0403_FIIPPAGN_02729 [Legionella sp.]|uniref:hypothetical protein n=1 Tax=Legionella sp. TaxID=459 RepID=UPI003D12EE75